MWQMVGQEQAVSLLRRGVAERSLAHAYLLTGPAHIGKMTLALDLARAVNCAEAEPPCGECPACRKIETGKHADVQVISLASEPEKNRTEISIDQIREVQRQTSLPPYEGRCKVFIIDGAEALSTEASNSLLKTLEEPGERVMFILLAADEKLLLPTVVSRCQHLRLSPLPAAKIESALIERFRIALEKAHLLSRLSHGVPGWAVSAAGDEHLLDEERNRVQKALDLIRGDMEARFSFASQLAIQFSHRDGKADETLKTWLDLWRDLLLSKAGKPEIITSIDLEKEISETAKGLSLEEIREFIHAIQEAGKQLAMNASPRLVFEVLMLVMPGVQGLRIE